MNETGNLYGTSFIARDMMQIVDALSEDGLLHYWGRLRKLGVEDIDSLITPRFLIRYNPRSYSCGYVPR